MKEISILPIEIVEFQSAYDIHFARLNYEWLEEFFVVESHDKEMLEAPEEYIIQPGGRILFAKIQNEIVGTVALIKESEGVYELAKMAVTTKYRSLGIGKKLMEAAMGYGRQIKAKKFFLDSNSKLKPALHLYETFGFKHTTPCADTPYERCDVRMEMYF